MQLNSLSLNPSTPPITSSFQLAVYDHNLAIVNTQVFVYGKNIQNYSIQTPLHKINLVTLKVDPVFTVNAPFFSQVMMFCFEQNLFLLGKTAHSQANELYVFDGIKFTKMDLFGPVPQLNSPFSFTKFSHRYLLLFSCKNGIQFQNKWYLFDIKQRQWKQIASAVQIPVSQKSHVLWQNARGYLFLQNCYRKNTQKFHKNLLYQIKFKNLNQFTLQLTEIPLPLHIKELDIVFSQFFSVNEKELVILGGQQIPISQKQQLIRSQIPVKTLDSKFDFKNTKIMFQFDLESFQWNHQFKTIPLKGQNHKIITFNSKIYTIGGILEDNLIKDIQVFDLKNWSNCSKFAYEQSLCYYCQCAFTYKQNSIYAPVVQAENETFAPRNRVENKFLKKFSQSIATEIHAIGILCEFLIENQCNKAQISLCEQINLHPRELAVKQKIQYEASQILAIRSFSNKIFSLSQLIESSTGDEDPLESDNLSISLTKIKLASFKLGYGLLYVTSTQEGHIFVSYSSYSQTDFPQSNFKSFSQVFYTIKWNKMLKTYDYSSKNKRRIIFQNVKMHFGNPQTYEHIEQETKKTKFHPFFNIFVIGVNKLEKALCIEPPKSKFIEDIKIKSFNKKNATNSLRKYLKHFYLTSSHLKLNLQNIEVDFLNVYEKFEELSKIMQIKQIPTNDEIWTKKAENQETHFSTNQDEVISWKKIDMIYQCKIYEVSKSELRSLVNIYNNVFVYHSKKLLKTIQTKNSAICGVIELKQNIQIQLQGMNFAHKSDQRRLIKWIEQIENEIIEDRCPSIEDV